MAGQQFAAALLPTLEKVMWFDKTSFWLYPIVRQNRMPLNL
jgi:hypothetical protein